jgi:hypothetical protein
MFCPPSAPPTSPIITDHVPAGSGTTTRASASRVRARRSRAASSGPPSSPDLQHSPDSSRATASAAKPGRAPRPGRGRRSQIAGTAGPIRPGRCRRQRSRLRATAASASPRAIGPTARPPGRLHGLRNRAPRPRAARRTARRGAPHRLIEHARRRRPVWSGRRREGWCAVLGRRPARRAGARARAGGSRVDADGQARSSRPAPGRSAGSREAGRACHPGASPRRAKAVRPRPRRPPRGGRSRRPPERGRGAPARGSASACGRRPGARRRRGRRSGPRSPATAWG